MKAPALHSFRLRNFKAVRDSGSVKLTPLTVFIGNNGSGKSSLIEGMETFQAIIEHGLDEAMLPWRGFEHIWYQGSSHEFRRPGDRRPYHTNPMAFELRGRLTRGRFSAIMEINLGEGGNELYIQHEEARISSFDYLRRDAWGATTKGIGGGATAGSSLESPATPDGRSRLGDYLEGTVGRWQFVSLVPDEMGAPRPQRRTGGALRLARNGSNIAEYLLDIRKTDVHRLNEIIEALQTVLPYAADLRPTLVETLERIVYLDMKEANFNVPGWLLSTGTLRLIALLACLRHPTPPPLLVVEEVENGLDPRTLHLLVAEIRAAITAGTTQVILTTHSPYLLDLLDLSHIVVVEREDGQPVFRRPDAERLAEWSKSFAPGRLYTMGQLT
jgi:predicted ATPase